MTFITLKFSKTDAYNHLCKYLKNSNIQKYYIASRKLLWLTDFSDNRRRLFLFFLKGKQIISSKTILSFLFIYKILS